MEDRRKNWFGHLPESCTFNELYDPLYLEIKAILPSLKLEAKAFLEATEIYKASEKAEKDGKESICDDFTSSFTAEELEAPFEPHVWAPSTTKGYGKFKAVELELERELDIVVKNTCPRDKYAKKVTTGPIPVATPSPAPQKSFTEIGVGSCWDASSGHAAGFQIRNDAGNDPDTCYATCVHAYGTACAGFHAAHTSNESFQCLIYTTGGDASKQIITSSNCGVNGNKASNCDYYTGATCYTVL
jgi:hypothetical protein